MYAYVTGISVVDEDLRGQIKYELTGHGIAPALFRIDEVSGALYLRNRSLLRDDSSLYYTVGF